MADNPTPIKGIILENDPEQVEHPILAETPGVGMNSKGNFEISNENIEGAAADSKVNIVSKSDIQVKTGDDGTLQLDCEKNVEEGDPVEYSIKVANGTYQKNNRVVGAKMNVAEITIDNQKAHTFSTGSEDHFDIDKVKINFRTDKWKTSPQAGPDTPTRRNNVGPVDVKLRAKSFDVRCHGDQPGGGIALQPSGRDTRGYENKIKFESSRISPIEDPQANYAPEGGEGLEFGTFNNEHTSLYTKDYRFKMDAPVYPVTRGVPVVAAGETKFDYPTQSDDFKDIVDENLYATWYDLIIAASSVTGRKNRSIKMDGKDKGSLAGWEDSNLELKTRTTYKWFQTPGDFTPSQEQAGAAIPLEAAPAVGVVYNTKDSEIADAEGNLLYITSELKLNKLTTQEQGWNTAQLYSFGSSYYVLATIASPGVKVESDGNIKHIAKGKVTAETPKFEIITPTGDVEISAGDSVQFDKSTVGPGAMIKAPTVKFDGPVVKRYNSVSISATGKFENGGYLQVAGYFNLQHAPVKYDPVAGKIYVLIEPIYSQSGTVIPSFEPDPNDDSKVKVYWDNEQSEPCAFLGPDGVTYESGAKAFLPQTTDNTKLWACDTTKKGELKAPKKAYDSVTGELSTGDAEHVICATRVSEGVYEGLPNTDYEHTVYVTSSDLIPASATVTFEPKREWAATVQTVSMEDIVTLVAWMKEHNQGPWQS